MILPVTGAPWEGVSYGCTTRQGGLSEGPWASLNLGPHTRDDPEAVLENRRRLAAVLPGEPFWLEQVHGIRVVEAGAARRRGRAGSVGAMPSGRDAGREAAPTGAPPPRADAAITLEPGRVLAVMTADCAPVVIADTLGRALGVAHAGWRGLAAGVLESTFAALTSRLPPDATWRAWVGPCIGQARFEVGDEVRQAFVGPDPVTADCFAPGGVQGKWQADLAALARHRLVTMGIQSVELSGLCTYERADLFYSYRRSAVTGRMATLAWLDPNAPAA